MEFATKSDLDLVHLATDYLRKHPRTSGLDVKSLRIRDYDRSVMDSVSPIRYLKLCVCFSVNGEPHDVEMFVQDNREVLLRRTSRVTYAVLDGHYDLLAGAEIW